MEYFATRPECEGCEFLIGAEKECAVIDARRQALDIESRNISQGNKEYPEPYKQVRNDKLLDYYYERIRELDIEQSITIMGAEALQKRCPNPTTFQLIWGAVSKRYGKKTFKCRVDLSK